MTGKGFDTFNYSESEEDWFIAAYVCAWKKSHRNWKPGEKPKI